MRESVRGACRRRASPRSRSRSRSPDGDDAARGRYGPHRPQPARHRLDPGEQLTDPERFDQVVIRTGPQTADPLDLRAQSRHRDDRRPRVLPQHPDHLDSVAVVEHQINQGHRELPLGDALTRGPNVRRPVHLVARRPQCPGQGARHPVVVLDNQRAHMKKR